MLSRWRFQSSGVYAVEPLVKFCFSSQEKTIIRPCTTYERASVNGVRWRAREALRLTNSTYGGALGQVLLLFTREDHYPSLHNVRARQREWSSLARP
jgi:hypothetical protein